MITRIVLWPAVAAGCLIAAVGVVALPAAAVLGWLTIGVLVGGLTWASAQAPAADRPRAPRAGYEAGILAGTAAVVGALLVAGLVILLGPPVGVLLTAAIAAAGWACWSYGRRRTPAEMSIEQLCLAWRQSYAALQDAALGPDRDRVVWVRAGYLDELERRDQQGFNRWLETGARAGSDPDRYLGAKGSTPDQLR